MSEPEQLIGKVASIINERELTINIGIIAGVKVGMIFKVLADRPLEVRDPDNDQILGSLDREKVRVKVSEVFELFSICRTYVTHTTVGRGGLMGITSAALLYGEPAKEVVETLKAEDHTLPPPLSEEESYVKRGDRVIIVKSPD